MGSEYVLRLRRVVPGELRSEKEILQKDPQDPFLGPGDRPEPSRSYYIAYARLEPIFQREQVYPADRRHTARAGTHLEVVALHDGHLAHETSGDRLGARGKSDLS